MSYQSTVLVEALALGVPSVSICGNASPGGLAETLGMPELSESIVHVDSVKALIGLLSDYWGNTQARDHWRHRTREAGNRVFVPGFVENAVREINALIDGTPRARGGKRNGNAAAVQQ